MPSSRSQRRRSGQGTGTDVVCADFHAPNSDDGAKSGSAAVTSNGGAGGGGGAQSGCERGARDGGDPLGVMSATCASNAGSW